MRIQCTCSHCGSVLERFPSQIVGGVFCDQECYRAAWAASFSKRFWSRVDKGGPVPAHTPWLGQCWIWTGNRHQDGRGRTRYQGKDRIASVVAYILTNGEPPTETPYVLHACDGGYIACVRPSHLFAGTKADNTADMMAKGRDAFGERHWAKLHPERRARGERHGSVTHPERLRRGSARADAKLTESNALEIRARASAGESQTSIAKSFGVNQTTISHVVLRKTWAHVLAP